MKLSWKTTLAGVLTIAILALHQFYPAVFTDQLVGTITTILVSLGLIVAKDSNVTGGTVSNGDTLKP